jgi:hypothetical protein
MAYLLDANVFISAKRLHYPGPIQKEEIRRNHFWRTPKARLAHTAPLHSGGHGNCSKTLIVAGPGRSLEAP